MSCLGQLNSSEAGTAVLVQQAHSRRFGIKVPGKQDQVPEAWRFTGGIDQSESSSRKNLIANTPGTSLFSLGNDFLPWRDRILQVDLGFPARCYISQAEIRLQIQRGVELQLDQTNRGIGPIWGVVSSPRSISTRSTKHQPQPSGGS